MSSFFQSDGEDLFRYSIEVSMGEPVSVRTMDGRVRYMQPMQNPEAELTLHDLSMDEAKAVIDLLNGMRAGARSLPVPKPRTMQSRFAGLEI